MPNKALGAKLVAFAKDDPRAGLKPIEAAEPERLAPSQMYHFDIEEPSETSPFLRTWYGRAKNFVVAYCEAEIGAVITRNDECDEHLLMLHDDACQVEITWQGEVYVASGRSLVILPPGDVGLSVTGPGRLVLASTTRSAPQLAAKCECEPGLINDPNADDFAPWPAPHDGYKVRIYDLDQPPLQGAFGSVWRCSSFLIIGSGWIEGERDPSKLSPHSHVNFQQCNIVLAGDWRFNLRWPWLRDKNQWRPDEQHEMSAPGLAMIPAQALHTVEWRGQGQHHCIDIYAPPRPDFVEMGWSINDEEYPRP